MANIKISDLPPAITPLDNDNTLLETTVLEAGQEVSRRINVSDIVAAISGLDATFLTVSANANLPNERVLTEGTNVSFVDTGPNGTLTINVSGAGFGDVTKVGTPVINELPVWDGDGPLRASPDFLVIGDLLRATLGNGPGMRNISSTTGIVASLIPRHGDPNTGIGNAGDDRLSLVAGAVAGMILVEAGAGVVHAFDSGLGLTAFAGGGQVSATVLFSSYSVVTTVASPGDSVKLTGSNQVGSVMYIKNDGANACDVFPAVGDDLGFGVGVALSLPAGQSAAFILTVTNLTWTQLIFEAGSGGADVFKVGTPVDNQIGVWTGDGTIEGDARLIWTGSRFELFGSGLSNRMRMEHDDTDFNMTAINGGAFNIGGLGDGIDIESNASSPTGNVYFKVHGDADNAGDFNVARFVNDNAGDAGGTRIDIIGQRDTVAGLVRILHSGVNHLGTPITSGPTGTVGGIGTQGAAIPFSLFTNLIERVRIEGTGEVGIRHGNVLAIYDATDADSLKWSHDGVDGLLATVGTGDLNITGLTGRIMQDAETLAFVSEITGVPDPLLLSDGSAAAPSYSFTSDTDIGMFRVGADILGLAARATLIAQAVGALGANQFVVAPGAVQNNVSAPDLGLGDGDTGVMQTIDDTIALVAGANLAVRYAEASSSVIQTNSSDVALTASVTQTQAGGLALLDSYNEVSIVGTTGDALTAFDVFQGTRLVVVNNGANALQLFPAVGDDFGAGVDASITIAAGAIGVFLGRDSINWDILFNAFSSGVAGGDVFKVGTPVDNQIGVWTGDGTIEGDPDFIWTGDQLVLPTGSSAGAPELTFGAAANRPGIFSGSATQMRFAVDGTERFTITSDQFQGFLAGSARMVNRVSSATVPTFVPNTNDDNTGLGGDGADALSLIAGGVEIARATEAAEDQFIISPGALLGSAALPSLAWGDGDTGFNEGIDDNLGVSIAGVQRFFWEGDAFNALAGTGPAMLNLASGALIPVLVPKRNDPNTGLASGGNDILTLPVGGVEALRLAEVSSQIIQTNSNHVGLTASVTQTQVGGLALLSSYNEIATVANSGDALTAFGVAEGSRLIVVNNGANDLQLFPASGDDIGAGVDTAITITTGAIGIFLGRTAVIWDTLFNGTPTHEIPNDAVQARRTTGLTLTTAFVDVTLDTTDVETDAAVLDHDLVTNTDNIIIGVTGTYEIYYQFDVANTSDSNSVIEVDGRVRLNDLGTGIPGSLASNVALRQHGNILPGRLSGKFIVDLTAADFVTLQVQKIDLQNTEAYDITDVSLQATRLL